ncbi:BglG family transcription antiterminator [Pelosinus sp. IPA-1]|uniref:BglG family transcription antiterminator n=1 Tax=Pelosinus sp. IPA-1 TaxID=3029569 RepID=UPI002436152A|nr:BglG family transcription antiterminator [Pelosinus sp. IPA-1]GMB01156.1 transcriptional regulator ManR [Pelosinus sp. IPA-1]
MERVIQIAMLLLESEKPIVVDEIASKLKVSNKTIRNDFIKLQEIVEREGLKLVKKTGVGTSIDGAEKSKVNLLQTIKRDMSYIEPYSPEGRQIYILEKLFMEGAEVTSYGLAEELFVSITTLHNDLKHVEEWIKAYNLKIVKKKNAQIEISGKEADYRKAISSIILLGKETDKAKATLGQEWHGRIDFFSMRQLKALINIDYAKIEKIVNELEMQLQFRFSQEAYISLISHIAIAIKRINSERKILLSDEIANSIKDTKEFLYAKKMGLQIEEAFKVVLPETEIGYLTLHILGSKMHEKDLVDLNVPFENAEELEIVVEIAKNIIAIASETLHINLNDDNALMNGLILHLRPTVNRLKYGLSLRNPILEDIKTNCSDIFGVAWLSSGIFEKYLNVKIPESEIGYITLHLAAAVERNIKKIKTLVVCHSGIGTSQFLSERLRRSFKEIEIIGIISSTELKDEILKNTQIIISTVPLTINHPILVISPLFTRNDIRKVEQFIDSLENKSKKNIMKKEYFFKSKKNQSREELIFEICDSLEDKQYVTSEFKESVLLRENMMSTEVGRGIVIPHGDANKVKQSCISLTVLQHPMRWKKEKVEFIFMLCITEQDMENSKYIFRNLCRQMDKPEFLEGLRGEVKEVEVLLEKLMVHS